MKSQRQRWLLTAFLPIFFAGCVPQNNLPPIDDIPPPVIKMPANDDTPRQKISLGAALFSGKIILDASKITEAEGIFTVPVFLEQVDADSNLDTVNLKFSLPEGISLSRVLTPAGFSTEIEGISSKNPVIYFVGNESEDSPKIIASNYPIFSLVFRGKKSGEIAIRGGFFFRDGTLKQTNRAVFQVGE